MMVRTLRLERGWSQEQLAQMTGLNIRTIQRIEGGQKAGLESLKSLAAVFEVELSELNPQQEQPPMSDLLIKSTINPVSEAAAEPSVTAPSAAAATAGASSKQKLKHARAKVLILGARFSLIIGMLFAINLITSPDHIWAWWPALGMGIAFAFRCVDKLIVDPLKDQMDSK